MRFATNSLDMGVRVSARSDGGPGSRQEPKGEKERMSEHKKIGNPFDEANFISGGGLWDGKTVTILGAKCIIDRLTNADGSSVINDRTGEPAVKNVLAITGVADEEEAERRETYSAGALVPTADGDGFVRPDGTPQAFHKGCEMAKFSKSIKDGGFQIASLWDDEAQQMRVSRLVGARFVFKGEPTLDKDGKPKKNKKGYDVMKFYPVQFTGMKAGATGTVTESGANDLRDKAVEVVLDVLTAAGGKIGRAELVRKVSAAMAGDPRCNKVLALVTRDDFHKGVPWTRDATGFSL